MTKNTVSPKKSPPHSLATAKQKGVREAKLAAALRRNLLRRKGKSTETSSSEA